MYFMKQSHEELKTRLTNLEKFKDDAKDIYFKKEDFREFKEELWNRLDKIEISFDKKVQELKK